MQPRESRRAAEILIDASMIDDVVTMRAPRRRLQVGRAVQMTDAEFGQILSEIRGVVESESGM